MESKSCLFGKTSEMIPLSSPKGKKQLCELCQQEARLQCDECRVTFYCTAEHHQEDWVGIHERICQLLVPIRTPAPFSLQQTDCTERQHKKVELIEICRSVAKSKLCEGKHQEALPAAQSCLRCSMDLYGPSPVQMVPAYLLFAEANMGLGNLAQAAQLLSQAEWAVLKSPEHPVHHQLYRSLGRLHTATGNLDAALFNFANDIYFASEEYGVDSLVTCDGYFLMADVFAKQGKVDVVHSMYSTVTHTWHRHLTQLLETHVQNVQDPDAVLSYDEAQPVKVDAMLNTMLEFEQNYSRKDSALIALLEHCLDMFRLKAVGFGRDALQASQLIPNHDLTEPIEGLLQLVQGPQTQSHPGSDLSP